jgi:hypothetical protein
MSAGRTWVALYRRLIHLYPAAFQAEFGEEMLAVFAEKLAEAGPRAPAAAWRELADLPFNLLQEHLHHSEMNHMLERILTHHKYSRQRQAAALGFALAFGLFELANGLLQILSASSTRYVGWVGVVWPKVFNQPDGTIRLVWPSYSSPDGSLQPTLLNLAIVAMLALGGLTAGLVAARAAKPPRSLRFGLAGAFSLPAAYVATTFLAGLLASDQRMPALVYAPFNLLSALLFAALAAVLFGWLSGVSPARLGRMALAGAAGWVGGLVLGGLAALAIAVVWGVLGTLVAFVIHGDFSTVNSFSGLWAGLVATIPVSAVQGWIFGGWLGAEMDGGEARQQQQIKASGAAIS